MAQFARPDSNITQTSFTGGFAEIDEATFSDADLAWGADNTVAVLEVGLSNVTDPASSSGHAVRWRRAKTNDGVLDGAGNAVTMTIELYQGTTLIAQLRVDDPLTGSWVGDGRTLSAAQADAITDYTDLRLRFTTSQSGGNPSNRRGGAVSWAELEVPDASADRLAELSWAEVEVPTAPRAAELSWSEVEVPNAPRSAELSWAELEVPTAPRIAELSWAELEVPLAPRAAEVSWAEIEIPSLGVSAEVSWAEVEVPTASRGAEVSWVEIEIPNAPRAAELSWAELQVPTVGGEDYSSRPYIMAMMGVD